MDLNLKSLIGKLNPTCHRALEAAAGVCLSRTNYDVELEHLLLKLNEASDADMAKILRHFEIGADRVNAQLTRALDRLKTGNARTPALSPGLVDALQQAWLLSSLEFGLARVRSGAVLLAVLGDLKSAVQLRESCPELAKIATDQFKANFAKIVDGSSEDAESYAEVAGPAAAGLPTGKPGALTKTPSLDQFTIDLTANARAGKVDPVLGRDREIRQIVDILTRRRQNNPILTGEAGVGKTAVVEGFAMRVAEKDVPPPLQNVSVRTLDLGLLQAGAGIKGEFENRLKSVIDEVRRSPTPIILFIDEAHQMIGAGGQAGQGDAANLLKPALARGELRTIAATTWAEYKKYFEKDAALARRFQVVKVDEPSEEVAVTMMRGLVDMLENHHNVSILDEAVEASVKMSARYISGRQLPDKSVSLLDTACARVAIGQTAIPPAIEDARRQITLLETEQRILEAEQAVGTDHADKLEGVQKRLAATQEELARLEERWGKEKDLVDRIRDIRQQLQRSIKGSGNGAPGKRTGGLKPGAKPGEKPPVEEPPLSPEQVAQLRGQLEDLNAELKTLQGEHPLMQVCVDAQTVAEVISAWTGIPVGRMVANEIQTVLQLKDMLAQRVIGQDHALAAVEKRIQTSRASMDDPRKPIGVFLMVGPSGVGKTETAVILADLLYGGERNMVTINMSEYQEAHTVSGLKGSPPGYVGYGEGGVLTEAVRRKPYSVVLLDEVEKAHPDVMELFFQVFDKGMLEDGEGREIDFKNTIIILTTNVATDTIMNLCSDPETAPDADGLARAIRPELEKAFPPALLGRLVVCPYFPIKDEIMKKIIRLKLGKIVRRVAENHRAVLGYDEALVQEVANRCTEVSSGARNVDNILTNTLLPELSREILARMAEGREIRKLQVGIGTDGNFSYEFA
jgi:type VI secretion system protein VasG